MNQAIQITLSILKEFEKCRLKAYQDSRDVWTCGWGIVFMSDGSKVGPDTVFTQEKADFELMFRVNHDLERVLDICFPVKMQDCELGALLSLSYNIGFSGLRNSSIMSLIHDPSFRFGNNTTVVADKFLEFNKQRNPITQELEVVDGLSRRRKKERDLFLGIS